MATYCLVLSKGTYLVDSGARARVLAAIEQGDRVVEIELDRYHDGGRTSATIVTAHVVAFFAHDESNDDELPLPANVTTLARRR